MGIFTSEVPARELFACKNDRLLKAKMDKISAAHPGLVRGALHNKALNKLWKQADQEQWEAKAAAAAADIDV